MKTKYALMALTALARAYDREALLIADLARTEHIPKKFLEAILLALKNQGILASRKGPGGGYSLVVPPGALTIGRIVRVFEGDLAPVPCLADAVPAKCPECAEMESCGIRLVMDDVKNAITSVLDRTTLADMMERSDLERRKRMKLVDYTI